ncbi:MAG: hypothetical protein JOZ46_05250 [Candidatus Dormibacteraeota bacterium]|nr:hypothetical protein [Candidatus Dormibacteraeota bacterium]MBV9525203.1 hypothetical protein [Candidatus Dormibacteraeota bacterium]
MAADKKSKARIVLTRPPKDLGEMTDGELQVFAEQLWNGIIDAGKDEATTGADQDPANLEAPSQER